MRNFMEKIPEEESKIVYVPVKKDLYDMVHACCVESNVELNDIVDLSLKNSLFGYIDNRNKEYRERDISIDELHEIYPGICMHHLPAIKEAINEDRLGVIPEEYMRGSYPIKEIVAEDEDNSVPATISNTEMTNQIIEAAKVVSDLLAKHGKVDIGITLSLPMEDE